MIRRRLLLQRIEDSLDGCRVRFFRVKDCRLSSAGWTVLIVGEADIHVRCRIYVLGATGGPELSNRGHDCRRTFWLKDYYAAPSGVAQILDDQQA